jgi:hypothetical protein
MNLVAACVGLMLSIDALLVVSYLWVKRIGALEREERSNRAKQEVEAMEDLEKGTTAVQLQGSLFFQMNRM